MSNSKVIYFPGLNGLRALAALAVVVSHITLALKEFNLNPHLFGTFSDGNPKGLDLAGYGVSIFFALSGFLITYLLQCEKDIGTIDIKKFYIRRVLRIWPLYYLYLFISVLLIFFCFHSIDISSLMLYIFYAANVPFILGTTLPFLAHYWSLGVEEQFYLFWPFINKYIHNVFLFFFIFTFLLIGLKLILHFFYPNSIIENIIHVTRFHCMSIGALGAILFKNKKYLYFIDNKYLQIFAWAIIALVATNNYHTASIIDNEIISCVTVIIIIGQINKANRIVNLEINILDYLGKISYGMYVVHPIIIFLYSKILNNFNISINLKYFVVYGLIILTTLLVSHISYTFFESKFLKYKKRFEIVKSKSSKIQ